MDLENSTGELSCVMQTLINDSYVYEVAPAAETAVGIFVIFYNSAAVLAGFCLNHTLAFFMTVKILCLDMIMAILMLVSVPSAILGGGWVLGPHWCIASSFISITSVLLRMHTMHGGVSCRQFLPRLYATLVSQNAQEDCLYFTAPVMASICSHQLFTSTWNSRLLRLSQ